MCRKRLLPFPSTAGARSARLPTRHSARRAVARSGPAARRPFEIAPRRPAVPPATSWPGLSRPSIGPRTREEAWRREMPGYPDTRNPEQVRARPGMTGMVGRSDGSHPQGRRRPQPTPPLHQPFLIPQAPGAFAQAPGAHSASLATRRSARGAVAPSGPLRSPVPVSGERLVGCRARRLLSRSPGRRPGARDCAPRRMARRQASGARARR